MKVIENNKSAMVGISTIGEHSIAKGSECHIISLVRDKLYPNPDKAALCETICNAIDEHRKHAVKRPVDVVITKTEVVVRDYANGLSMEDVVNVFFAFGASTKKDSDEAIGGFGIGAKAPSAYAQSWTVESRYKGKHTGYVTTLNGVKGVIGKLFEKDCAPDDTGITVRFPLKKSDHYENFLNLSLDMYMQIGFFNDEEELRVYAAKDLSSYNDFAYLAETNPESAAKYDAVKAFNMSSWKNLRKNNSNGQYVENVGFILPGFVNYTYSSSPLDKWRANLVTDRLGSNFFRKTRSCYGSGYSSHWAYDGDMMYKIPNISFPHTGTYIENRSSSYNNNSVVVLLIPKGKFQIAPSREALIASSELENYMKEQYRRLFHGYNNQLIKKAEELFSDKKNDFFSALYTFVKNVFFPFTATQLPFYPTYGIIHNNDVGYTLSASYIISNAAYLVRTRIAEGSVFNIDDNIVVAASTDLEKIPLSKIGRDNYSFSGVIVNVAVDKNKIHTINTRIARAALIWLLENMTETQKQCYSHIRDGMMVNVYHVEGSCDENHADDIYPTISIGVPEGLSCRKYIELFPPHTWLCISTLQPYLDKLSNYIIEKSKEEAKIVREDKPEVKKLVDVCHKTIPEASYVNTLLIAPSQEDLYSSVIQALQNEYHTMYGFVKALLVSLDIEHVAICAKANMRPYLAKGARTAESVDLAKACYKLIWKHGFIFVPTELHNLLSINSVNCKFYEQMQKENIYEIDRGMYKHYTCYYQSAVRLIKSLPNGLEISKVWEEETKRIQQHVADVFSKLSVSDKLVLYDAEMAGNLVRHSRGMLCPTITANHVLYEKLDERLLKLLEKAENILLNKFLPKLNLVWNPNLDNITNTNK